MHAEERNMCVVRRLRCILTLNRDVECLKSAMEISHHNVPKNNTSHAYIAKCVDWTETKR